MRVSFFYSKDEDEPHLFDVEDMQVPNVGESVWISAEKLPKEFCGHKECVVVRKSYSVICLSTTLGGQIRSMLTASAHAEILLEVKK